MAANVKWNRAAFEEIRRSPKVAADLARRAAAIADACGGDAAGYVSQSGQGRTRARAAVITATGKAIRSNAVDNVILRNLDAGR